MTNNILFDEHTAHWLAGVLIQSNAYRVQKDPDRSAWFTWKSGIVAPVYCNTRQLMSHPFGRMLALSGLLAALRQCFPHVEGVLGMATAGIPWAAPLAHLADLPSGYIRSAPKDHGLGGLIEYYDSSARRVLLVDDLVASGGSLKKAIAIARNSGLQVEGVLSIVNWGFPRMYQELAGVPVKCLVSYNQIVRLLPVDDQAREDLCRFYANPQAHVWTSPTFAVPTPEVTS